MPTDTPDPVRALNHDGEPLHSGDDDRIDCVTSILAALDDLDDPHGGDADEVIASIRAECGRLDALLISTIQREREAATLAPRPQDDEAETCEGCGVELGYSEQPYVTRDDVWLCRRCYEAVPARPAPQEGAE